MSKDLFRNFYKERTFSSSPVVSTPTLEIPTPTNTSDIYTWRHRDRILAVVKQMPGLTSEELAFAAGISNQSSFRNRVVDLEKEGKVQNLNGRWYLAATLEFLELPEFPIGQSIKARRIANRLTQSSVGDACGMNQRTVSGYETGEDKISQTALRKLMNAICNGGRHELETATNQQHITEVSSACSSVEHSLLAIHQTLANCECDAGLEAIRLVRIQLAALKAGRK